MSLPPEILVHISAPSQALDDARYRRELQSFLKFEPVHRQSLTAQNVETEPRSEYEDALRQVADATFTSSSSATSRKKPQIAKDKVVTPASAICNVSGKPHWKSPALIPGTTSHKATNRSRLLQSPQRRPRTAPSGSSGSLGIQETPLPPRAQSDSWKTPPSVIPDSQPTPYSLKRSQPHLQSSSPSPTRRSSPTTRNKRQRIASPPALPQFEIPDEDEDDGDSYDARSSAPQQPPNSSAYGADAEASSTPLAAPPSPRFIPTSTQIHPPRAPISTASFATQNRRTHQAHAPGHWRVDITSFDEERKIGFWGFLELYIRAGKAGWGVWCALEGREEREERGVEEEGVVARIYCWGEVVGEVWNVLFLASRRRIQGTGACWVDAEGMVVVRMK
ncbi:hypothetical protein G7Y79_00004g014920 [Physcia stellaris]|nr:hypothetical protein G7Y79_00004g014920 [Physcia stellaris]